MALAIEGCHNVNFVVTGGTGGCRYDNLRCHQWRQIRFSSNVVIWLTLLSLVVSDVVVMTPYGTTSDNKVGMMTTHGFQWYSHHNIQWIVCGMFATDLILTHTDCDVDALENLPKFSAISPRNNDMYIAISGKYTFSTKKHSEWKPAPMLCLRSLGLAKHQTRWPRLLKKWKKKIIQKGIQNITRIWSIVPCMIFYLSWKFRYNPVKCFTEVSERKLKWAR